MDRATAIQPISATAPGIAQGLKPARSSRMALRAFVTAERRKLDLMAPPVKELQPFASLRILIA